MELVIYRHTEDHSLAKGPCASGDLDNRQVSHTCTSTQEGAQPLSPGLFYPLVSAQEMETWAHWLPTVMAFDRARVPASEVINTLTQLHTPPEVFEELQWAWKMDLFEAYEVRTPVRRDSRDPVLLGRLGEQRYRMALWGESIRPLEEITSLVNQSLAIKAHAIKWRNYAMSAGTLVGFGLGVWLGSHPSFEGDPLSLGVMLALIGLFSTWFPSVVYAPENRQHDFLDRYRC
jgi:hypothetical protein